jgi:divalent metal cation (Fe/Co/Zn/Cd) transporter
MDTALPTEELTTIERILQKYTEDGRAAYHKLRTRRAGPKRFIDFHLLVPGGRTVKETHDLCEQIESEIQSALGEASITIHVEPLEDPASWEEGAPERASTS